QVVDDRGRPRRVVEPLLDAVVAQDAADRGDIERAVLEGDAVRRLEAARDDAGFAAPGRHGIDLVAARADEERPVRAEGERARLGQPRGVDADREAFGQADVGYTGRRGNHRTGQRDDQEQAHALRTRPGFAGSK